MMLLAEAQFFEAIHDPFRGAGRLEQVKTCETLKVELDPAMGLIIVSPMLKEKPDPSGSVSVVPLANVRSMRLRHETLWPKSNQKP